MANDFLHLGDTPARPIGRIAAWVKYTNSTVFLCNMPAVAFVTNVRVHVTEAFNAGSSNTLTVGWTSTTNALMTALTVSSTGLKTPTLGSSVGYNATAQTVSVYYSQSGTAATTGKAIVIIEFYPQLPPPPS